MGTAVTVSKTVNCSGSVVSQPAEVSDCFNFTAAEPARIEVTSATMPTNLSRTSVHAQRGTTTSHAVVEEEIVP